LDSANYRYRVELDWPAGSAKATGQPSVACPAQNGECVEIDLVSSSSQKWQLSGQPLVQSTPVSDWLFVTDVGNCSAGCDLAQANNFNIVNDKLFVTGNTPGYTEKTTEDSIDPSTGFWLATLPGSSGMNVKILIPASN